MKKSKRTTTLLVITLMAVLAVVPVVFTACNNDDTAEIPAPTSYVTVDINPSVELVLDQKQTVLSVKAANADAEVMLYNSDGIVGANVNVAVSNIAKLAVEMNYVDDGTHTVSVTVASDSVRNAGGIYNGVKAKMEAEFSKENITAKVERAVDIVLENEVERIKTANAGKDGYNTLTVDKYRLVKAALRADRKLTMDEAVKMTDAQLAAKVNSAIANAEEKFGAAYALLKSEAQFAYETIKQGVLDSAYSMTYAMNGDILSLATPSKYTALRLAHRNLEHYYNLLHDLYLNPVIDKNDALDMLNALGIPTEDVETFIEELTEDGTVDGKITKDSFAAYLNKIYRNMDAQKKAAVDEAYAYVQNKLDEYGISASRVNDGDKAFIEVAIGALGLDVKLEYNVFDVNHTLAALDEAINETYAEIENELKGKTHDMSFAKELQADMAEDYADAEKEFSDKLNEYKENAKKMLERLQAERKESSVAAA